MAQAFCNQPAPDIGMVKGLLFSVDCNVQSMTEASYGALSQPNSPMAAALTILLTLYIGFMGFRLLIGRAPMRVGDLTVSVLKIGAVLALATNWPTYQQVVFDVLFRGPEQLAAIMLRTIPAAAAESDGDVFATLQLVYDRLQVSANQFSQSGLGIISPLQGGTGFAALSLNAAAQILLLSTLGVVLAAKIVLGLLLGLGPVFIALLLFEATHGLFVGWLRAALAFALAPLAAIVGLALQLLLIVPELDRLQESMGQTQVAQASANAILLLSLICAGVSGALLIATGVIAASLRIRSHGPMAAASREVVGATSREAGSEQPIWRSAALSAQDPMQSRALAIANAASAMERREVAVGSSDPTAPRARINIASQPAAAPSQAEARMGQAGRRRAQPVRRASNLRRDA